MTAHTSEFRDLEKYLNRLISFFPQWENWLSWSQVLFVEDSSFTLGSFSKIPRSALMRVNDYAKRFDELLDGGYPWINMNALGIWQDNLIVVIELPSYKSNISRDKISVNFSGPAIMNEKAQWDLSKRIEVLE